MHNMLVELKQSEKYNISINLKMNLLNIIP